jgi:predicted kinase
MSTGTLHFVCGKIAAGKTTLARQLAAEYDAVMFSEDVWLSRMYPHVHFDLNDYLRRSTRLRAALAPHVVDLLRRGTSVVFDFAGNTTRDRQWVRSIFEEAGAPHLLHFLDAQDSVCKARLRRRNIDAPAGSQFTTDEEFDTITRYFRPPEGSEGYLIAIYEVGPD